MADNATHPISGKGGNITGQVGLGTTAEIRIGIHGWRMRSKSPLREVTKYGDAGKPKFDGTMTYSDIDIACFMLAASMPQLANLGTQHTINVWVDEDNTAGYTGTITSSDIEWALPLNRGGYDTHVFGRLKGTFYGAVTEDAL